METLFIPYVEEVDQKPAVTKYYVWKRGEAEGMFDSQTALLSFFTQNQKEEYTLTLADGVMCVCLHRIIRLSFHRQKKNRLSQK